MGLVFMIHINILNMQFLNKLFNVCQGKHLQILIKLKFYK